MSLACPNCGEEEHLRGERSGSLIAVTCETCGVVWTRDPDRPSCPSCGGDDVVSAPKALVEKSRGTQLSIVGTTTTHFCRACDSEALAEYLAVPARRFVMPKQLPTLPGDDPEIGS